MDEISAATNSSQSSNSLEEIYSILLLCIKGNKDSSNYLMKLNLKPLSTEHKVLKFLLD